MILIASGYIASHKQKGIFNEGNSQREQTVVV